MVRLALVPEPIRRSVEGEFLWAEKGEPARWELGRVLLEKMLGSGFGSVTMGEP